MTSVKSPWNAVAWALPATLGATAIVAFLGMSATESQPTSQPANGANTVVQAPGSITLADNDGSDDDGDVLGNQEQFCSANPDQC